MNTIPLIFNQRQIKRTVIGGSEFAAPADQCLPLSIILLNRGARHYKTQIFQHLMKFNFRSMISVEQSGDNYELENLARNYPFVKFLIPLEPVTTGDMINMAMSELDSDYVLVLWNDAALPNHSLSVKFIEKIIQDNILCQIPCLINTMNQALPMEMVPFIENSAFKIKPRICYHDNIASLYPFDFMGIYNRKKFTELGGFDYTIKNPYWQNLDYFLRAWLWGEECRISSLFRVNYQEEISLEDITPDESYLRFYFKNIAPVYKVDHAELPVNKFFTYVRRSPRNFIEAIVEFKMTKTWIEASKYRFKNDVKTLIESWGNE